ncbi:MAG: hypothetical protein FJ014_06960 [Chloroflexi bacterium]|nr:hypothetical protein [Chloroflexota bacterium]
MSYYNRLPTEPSYAENQRILQWWTPQHDKLLVDQIAKDQWIWYLGITDRILEITPKETIESWRKKDPLCSKYAWYNVLMYFAAARAEQLHYTDKIRRPCRKTCGVCNREFSEGSLPASVIKHLGIDRIDVCLECINGIGQNSGSDTVSRDGIIKYLQDLTNALQSIPPQNFGESLSSLTNLTTEERVAVLKLNSSKPTIRRVKAVFRSWLNALIEAGVLESGTRPTSRGVHSIAKDGHVCLSLGEKTIDDFLFRNGIPHDKEFRYPEGNYKCDFRVSSRFIEYFGLTGDLEYEAKAKEKAQICQKHGITLIAIYPQDLVGPQELESKLSPLLKLQE